ncbi:hypothetical protein AB9E29_14990 [Rhizobium leguminosarum]|uniref:hypothetical protein n=1 Tax=Rhizobium leguminosarum TaxID=384 RepID=UPI003F973194
MLRISFVLGMTAWLSTVAPALSSELVPLGCILTPECWSSSSGARPESATEAGLILTEPDALGAPVATETVASTEATGHSEDERQALLGRARTFANAVAKAAPFRKQLNALERAERNEFPGVIGPWPEAFNERFKEYVKFPRTKACAADVTALAAISSIWGEVASLAGGFAGSEADRQALAIAVYQLYLTDCFERVETAPDYLDRLVLLGSFHEPSRFMPFCAGFLLKDNVMVTARHCVVPIGEAELFLGYYGPDERAKQIHVTKPVPLTRAMLLSDPRKLYSIQILPAGGVDYNPNIPEVDTLALVLKGLEEGREMYPLVAEPQQWMNLEMTGVHDVLIDLSVVDAWEDMTMLADRTASCTVFYVSPPCLFHSCQTRFGLSGTPLLARTSDGIALIGIHAGSVGAERPACDFKRKYSFPNYGLALGAVLAVGGEQ